jgi:predicted kinase
VLVGPPASGKTTLARHLAVRLPAVVVQSDAVRKALFPEPRYTPDEHQSVFATAHARLRDALGAGHHAVFDATNLEEQPRRVLYHIAATCGARVVVARLAIAPAIARARLAQRAIARASDDLSDADWLVYQTMAPRLQPIRGPHWVLNGAADPAALAALLAHRIVPSPEQPTPRSR